MDEWIEAAAEEARCVALGMLRERGRGAVLVGVGQGAGPVDVAVAERLLSALVAVRTEEGIKLQLDQLLQAVA